MPINILIGMCVMDTGIVFHDCPKKLDILDMNNEIISLINLQRFYRLVTTKFPTELLVVTTENSSCYRSRER